MKYAFASAALIAFAAAYGDDAAYPDKYAKETPDGMPESKQRYREVDAKYPYRFEKGAKLKGIEKKCRKNVRKFDEYCHNVNGDLQYADYRNKWDRQTKSKICNHCELGPDGLCVDATLEPLQFHCLAQQSAFDYCIWSREYYTQECEKAI